MAKVSRGIVITTSEYTKDFLKDCLLSLPENYPVLVVANNYSPVLPTYCPFKEGSVVFNNWNAFELGGILRGKETFDEFVHLMDTCLIKDTSLFDKLFEIEGNVFLTEGGYHYMGKFDSKSLPDIPKIDNKQDAISLELQWLKKPYTAFKPDLPVHTDVFEEKFGQHRMKLENDYIIKWKGTYYI